MKLAVYTDTPEVEKITRLKLKCSMYGIVLEVVDEEGESVPGGRLLDITTAGRVLFRDNVNPDLGFDLDSGGQVKHN